MSNNSTNIALITRTITQNQGNQALSIAWRDFLRRRYPDSKIRLLERVPAYLKRFTLQTLAESSDPIAAFDRLAQRLVAKASGSAAAEPTRVDVEYDFRKKRSPRFLKFRRLIAFRGLLAKFGYGEKSYLERLAYICSADLVVVNPAGEFAPTSTDTPLSYLLEARCAQVAGARTAFVNLSFEVEDRTLAALSDHVFAQCDVIEFRDIESADYLASLGGAAEPIVLPDGAAMSAIERTQSRGGKGLALAINALQARAHGLEDQWDAVIEQLSARGKITLTSNEWTTDFPFWQKYLARDGIECDGRTLPYDDYARFLSDFDVVVSSRLHTCVLGLVAGAPVVPVETETFKLTGFFNMIGMTDEVINTATAGWEDRLLARIEEVAGDRGGRLALQDRCLAAAREHFETVMGDAFGKGLLERRKP
jgi:polysaccharide pyruvyl transferase WcaK-like protein